MKETIYKSLILSLLLTNSWSVITFFIYFFESPGMFSGFKTLGFFIYSCWISAGLGLVIILLSFIKNLKIELKIFSLTLIMWTNLFFFILLLITITLEIIHCESFFDLFLFFNIIVTPISLLRIKTVYKLFEKQQKQKN